MTDQTDPVSVPDANVAESDSLAPANQKNPTRRHRRGSGETSPCAASDPALPQAGRALDRAVAPSSKLAPPGASVRVGPDGDFDLRAPELYLNRELTWFQFNARVLNEARDRRTPLLERVKFLAIASSNTDEFFMKRIGGLKQQIGAGVHKLTVDGRTPSQQLAECQAVIRDFQVQKREVYRDIVEDLRRHDIRIRSYAELTAEEQSAVRADYHENIFPLITPLAMDPAHPFPFISNLSLNLLVTLTYPDELELTMARIKVPVGASVPRFVRVGDRNHFVMLEDVMGHYLPDLFPGMRIVCWDVFRVTRNANTERDEEQEDDLVVMIEAELRSSL